MTEYATAKQQFFKQLYEAARLGVLTTLERLRHLPEQMLREIIEQEKINDNDDGSTALIAACRKGNKPCVQFLVEVFKADIEHAGTVKFDGETVERASPLWVAAASGHLEIVRLLVDRGAQINSTTKRNSTPLRAACFDGHFGVVQFLIEQGADAELPNIFGHTCLMIVCFKGHYEIAEYLLRRVRVNVNRACESGNSALHDAAESECAATRIKLIKLLLEHGAQMVANQDGVTPALAAALKQKNEDVVEYLVTAKRSGTKGSSGQGDLLSFAEKADALELLGCTLISESDGTEPLGDEPDRDIVTAMRHGASFWLRAERIRQRHNIPTPEYVGACPQLMAMLRNVIHDLPSVRLLETAASHTASLGAARDDAEADAMLVERYAHPTNMHIVYAHALIRRERLVGALHADSIYFAKMRAGIYADSAEYRPALCLLRYALACTLRREARERERERVARARGFVYASATNRDELDGPVTETIINEFLAFIELFDDILFRERAQIDFEHMLDVFELAVDEMGRAANELTADAAVRRSSGSKLEPSDANVSALIVMVVLQCVTIVRALRRVGASSEEIARFERAVRRACRTPLRTTQKQTLLHIATMNRFTLGALVADSRKQHSMNSDRDELDVRSVIQELTFANELPDSGTIELLLRGSANANVRDADGNTPLHLVAQQLVVYATNGHKHRPRTAPPVANLHIAPLFGEDVLMQQEMMDNGDDGDAEEHVSDEDCASFQRNLEKALRVNSLDSLFQRAIAASSNSLPSHVTPQNQNADALPHAAVGALQNQEINNDLQFPDVLAVMFAPNLNALANGDQNPAAENMEDVAGLRALTWRAVYQRAAIAIRILLAFTHADVANANGETFLDILRQARRSLRFKPHVLVPPGRTLGSLQCLCARRVRLSKLPYSSRLPSHLAHYVDSH